MKIFYLANTGVADGCTYYRNLLPASYLSDSGSAECRVHNKIPRFIDKDTKETVWDLGIVAWADILVLNRFYSAEKDFNLIKTIIEAAKFNNTKIVYETDDDFFNITKDNPSYEAAKANRELVLYLMEHADAYTTTTHRLANTLVERFPKKTYILPNSLYIAPFASIQPGLVPAKKKLRIGWGGGITHKKDLDIVLPVIKKLVEQGDAEFAVICADEMDSLIDFEHIHVPAVDPTAYPTFLRNMELDIAICPLRETRFNSNKSAVKWQEYSVCGFPTVYSNVPPYSDYIKNGVTGIGVENTAEAWETALTRLIKDKQLRTRIARTAQKEVIRKFDIEKNFILWHSSYKDILSR